MVTPVSAGLLNNGNEVAPHWNKDNACGRAARLKRVAG